MNSNSLILQNSENRLKNLENTIFYEFYEQSIDN